MATSATKSSTAKIPPAAVGNAWTGGSAVSAGGGRGLVPALKEPLRVIAHIDMDAFYAQIEQVNKAGNGMDLEHMPQSTKYVQRQ